MNISGNIVGYDPGGNFGHGIATLLVDRGKIQKASVQTLKTVEQVIEILESIESLIGIGVDTLTCWSTGDSGWRPADRWLRIKYPQVKNSIVSPNGLYGSMGLNGMAVLFFMKKLYPDLFITETHPKILFWFLTRERYDYSKNKDLMDKHLRLILEVSLAPKNEHEWDAAISAYAALSSLKGIWKRNLHELPAKDDERIISACGKTYYFWPE